jgi:hypothetical protein
MYAVGHGQPDKARDTLRSLGAGSIACADCELCAVQCALGLDIRANALELARMLEMHA